MLIDDCQVILSENIIEGNKKSGFICRNTSKTRRLRQNKFLNNRIQILIEKGWENISDI